MERRGYNGWSNYETWLLNLWYGDYLQDIANEENGLDPDQIESIIEEMLADSGELPENGFTADLLNAALANVNWHELANHYNEDIDREEEAA